MPSSSTVVSAESHTSVIDDRKRKGVLRAFLLNEYETILVATDTPLATHICSTNRTTSSSVALVLSALRSECELEAP